MLLIRPPLSRQPPLPAKTQVVGLADGLAHAWAIGRAGGGVRDLAGKADGTFGVGTGGTTGNYWRLGSGGSFIEFDDTGTGTTTSAALAVGNSAGSGGPVASVFSAQGRIRFESSGFNQSIYSGETGGLQFRVLPSGAISLVKRATAAIGDSSGTIAFGDEADIGVSYDGAVATFYINGKPAGTASGAQTFSAVQYYMGTGGVAGVISNDERVANGSRIYYLYVWNRPRSASEFAAVAASRWSIFGAPARRLWALSGGGAFNAATTEPATASESAQVALSASAAAAEFASSTDTALAVGAAAAAVAETGTATDAVAGSLAAAGAVAESATASETSSSALSAAASLTEPATPTDTPTAALQAAAAATEVATATENTNATASGNYTAGLTEVASAADSASASLQAAAAVTESATAAESSTAAAAGNYSAGITEAASATDAPTVALAAAAAATETATATDACTTTAAHQATATEATAATEASTGLPSGAYAAGTAEAATATDNAASTATLAAQAVEPAAAADTSAALRISFAQALETATPIVVSAAAWSAGAPPVTPARRTVVSNQSAGSRPRNLSTGRRGANRARS